MTSMEYKERLPDETQLNVKIAADLRYRNKNNGITEDSARYEDVQSENMVSRPNLPPAHAFNLITNS